jgi:hypothetical protein
MDIVVLLKKGKISSHPYSEEVERSLQGKDAELAY